MHHNNQNNSSAPAWYDPDCKSSIRDHADFRDDLERLSSTQHKGTIKALRKSIYDTIDARVRNAVNAALADRHLADRVQGGLTELTDEQAMKILPPLPPTSWDGDSRCNFHGEAYEYTTAEMVGFGVEVARAILSRQPMMGSEVRAEPKLTVRDGIWWPEGYCRDPNGVIVAPAGKHADFKFGYDIGYADGMAARKDALATMTNQNNSSAPDGDLFAAIMNLPSDVQSTVFASWTRAEQNAYCAGHRDARHAAAELVAAAEVAQPPIDRVQGGLTDEQIQAIWNEACYDTPQKPGWCRHIRYARAIESAILSRQSIMGGDPIGDFQAEARRAKLDEFISAAAPQEPVASLAWDAIALAVDEAEKQGLEYVTTNLLRKLLVKTRAAAHPLQEGSTTPANAAAANGDGLADAAAAVVARWDSPKWKDEAPTADFIARLRVAVEKYRASAADADGQKGEAA